MPLHWTIDSQKALFHVIAEGFVDKADADRMIDVMVASDILHYRKLFDGSAGDTRLSPMDVFTIGVRLRELHATGPMGPLAVVAAVARAGHAGRRETPDEDLQRSREGARMDGIRRHPREHARASVRRGRGRLARE